MSLRFQSEAAQEFYRAVEDYESESPGLGSELLADLERVGTLLISNPEMGGPGPGGTRRILLSRFPFRKRLTWT